MDFIDREVLESLEVIELDAHGRLMGPARWPAADPIRELADRPERSDPTGTAGIWEAFSHG